MEYNKNNFFEKTFGVFEICGNNIPNRQADFVSISGSRYWYESDGVFRLSGHWDHVASCYWVLEHKHEDAHRVYGFCRWADFREVTPEIVSACEKQHDPKYSRACDWCAAITKKEIKILEDAQGKARTRTADINGLLSWISKSLPEVTKKALKGCEVITSECTYAMFPKAYMRKGTPAGTICKFVFNASGRPVLTEASRGCTYRQLAFHMTDDAKKEVLENLHIV